MSKYRLHRISLKNFKLFGSEPYIVSFANDPLVIFDGPNGYGKTSVFDAIELAITGNIKRLYPVENKQVPSDLVVAHKDCPDVEILIEFSGDRPITIVRRLKKPLPPRGTRIDKFSDAWKLYTISDGKETEVAEEEFHKLLLNANMVRDYHLFHYVQQEETAHFLKSNKEHQRAEELTELFGDTKEAEAVRDKLDTITKKISAIKSRLVGEIKQIADKFDFSAQSGQSVSSQVAHQFMLPWLQAKSSSPEWDRESFSDFTVEKRNKYLEELSQIKVLVANRETFLAERMFRKVANAGKLLNSLIRYHLYLDRIEELQVKFNNLQLINSEIGKFTIEQIELLEDNKELDQLFGAINFTEKDKLFSRIKEITSARNLNQGNNQLYTELIRYRDEITKRFSKLDGKEKCPFCGSLFADPDDLLNAINERGEDYKALINEDGNKLIRLQISFEEEILQPLINRVLHYRNNLSAPTPELIAGMNDALKSKDQLNKLVNWLVEHHIEFIDLCVEYSSTLLPGPDCEQRCKQLVERIRAKSPTLQLEYTDTYSFESLERIYVDYFEANSEHLNGIDGELFDKKVAYIHFCYFNSLSNVIEKHGKLTLALQQLEDKSELVKKIKAVIQREIRIYQNKLITDIEIPFYIYSGKILQTHQSGLGNGIFVKDPTGGDELKNVRLVSDWNSDHDILNTMSSGQIAAVVISLTLALNRVYAKGFDTILIDDPVQTMDDINMISLVELLRNEFADRQIILSTHEEDVSRYFLYKYLKHGHTAMKINLMERKEYRLTNKNVTYAS